MNAMAWRLLTLASFLFAACGQPGRDATRADTRTAVATASPAPPAFPLFEAVGHHAENAYDRIKTADWAAARASADSVTAAIRAAQPSDTAAHGADLQRSLAGLDSAVARRSRTAGLREANRLTELGALLAAPHHPPVPAAVTLLDYYGRELEIWAEAKNVPKLAKTASALGKTWRGLRPRVLERGGKAEAARFDRILARVSVARTAAQYAATATPVLDEVDALEAVFKR